MIIILRGTSGAGKSTVARNLLRAWPHTAIEFTQTARGQKPLVYRVAAPGQHLFIFGSYETTCGGCDTITDYKTILPILMAKYAPLGNILMEGLLAANRYGRVGGAAKALQERGHRVVYARLDTALELCLERISARRAARGDMRPLNPHNTTTMFKAVIRAQEIVAGHGLEIATIGHSVAESEVAALLGLQWPARLSVQEVQPEATQGALF